MIYVDICNPLSLLKYNSPPLENKNGKGERKKGLSFYIICGGNRLRQHWLSAILI